MTQGQALHIMLSGASVFLTGPPGAGKTYVLNEYVQRAMRRSKRLAVTASTGIAATHIGGTTIHSWSGLGIRDELTPHDRQWLKDNDRLIKRYNSIDVLVIDEVSMLHGKRLDMVSEACKLLRENDAPFGGLQVILVGDLFQLPPVTRSSEMLDFAHMSQAWAELSPKVCYLTEQHRQEHDGLLDLLEAMRRGDVNELHESMLRERLGTKPTQDTSVTRLYAHNTDVESINQKHLAALPNETKLYTMQTKGSASKVEQLVKSVLAPEQLELKIGAEVMFVANNFQGGFVNGSRGRVVDIDDRWPMVELTRNGRKITVEPHTWTLTEDGKKRAEVTQLPLRLAWAITIHKSQGMSLDAAEIDLSRTFTPGMGYVALSRVRSIDGVFLNGINNMALQMHPDIFIFDNQLQELSSTLAADTPEVQDETEPEKSELQTAIDEALFEKLRAWRLARARKDKVAPFIVAHDTALTEIASRKPASSRELLALKGFGSKKLEAYGSDILDVIATHTGQATLDDTAWSAAEDDTLLQLFHAGQPLSQVAKVLDRDPTELWKRLSALLRNEE